MKHFNLGVYERLGWKILNVSSSWQLPTELVATRFVSREKWRVRRRQVNASLSAQALFGDSQSQQILPLVVSRKRSGFIADGKNPNGTFPRETQIVAEIVWWGTRVGHSVWQSWWITKQKELPKVLFTSYFGFLTGRYLQGVFPLHLFQLLWQEVKWNKSGAYGGHLIHKALNLAAGVAAESRKHWIMRQTPWRGHPRFRWDTCHWREIPGEYAHNSTPVYSGHAPTHWGDTKQNKGQLFFDRHWGVYI